MVRTVTASRLVNLYTSFCKEEEFQPLGRSTLFNILKVGVVGDGGGGDFVIRETS